MRPLGFNKFNTYNINLMTNFFNKVAPVERRGRFHGPPDSSKRSIPHKENISLEAGTVTSIWHNDSFDFNAINFNIDGQENVRKAVYRSLCNDKASFEEWLDQHSNNKYELLIVESGEKIKNIGSILIKWSQKADRMHSHNIVVFDRCGLISLTALADHCFEVSDNGSVTELYPDF